MQNITFVNSNQTHHYDYGYVQAPSMIREPMMTTKSVLITGAGHGFGRGVAFELAKKGYQVIATAEIESQVTDLMREAKEQNLKMTIFKLDVTNSDDYKQLEDHKVDVLLNNAGVGQSGPIAEQPMHRVRDVFETNVFGNLALTQYVVKHKFVPQRSGKIVNVSSIAGILTVPYLGAYCASKHALEALTYALNEELNAFNIVACTVNPGAYATGFNDRMFGTAFTWLDPDANFTSASEIKASAQPLLDNQMDPQAMIDKMVEVIISEDHLYRNVYPPQDDENCRAFEQQVWTKRVEEKRHVQRTNPYLR